MVHEETPLRCHLYRIAQESINNAMKHGKARQIEISLADAAGVTTLRITDNGAGISNRHGGFARHGFEYHELSGAVSGGELRIDEPPRGGTIVSCIVWPQQPGIA